MHANCALFFCFNNYKRRPKQVHIAKTIEWITIGSRLNFDGESNPEHRLKVVRKVFKISMEEFKD